jgi:hypothetical protein
MFSKKRKIDTESLGSKTVDTVLTFQASFPEQLGKVTAERDAAIEQLTIQAQRITELEAENKHLQTELSVALTSQSIKIVEENNDQIMERSSASCNMFFTPLKASTAAFNSSSSSNSQQSIDVTCDKKVLEAKKSVLKITEGLSVVKIELQNQLTKACYNADIDEVKRLVEEKGADPTRSDAKGQQPLAAAIWGLAFDVITYLESQANYTKQDWKQIVNSIVSLHGRILPYSKHYETLKDITNHYRSKIAPFMYDCTLLSNRIKQCLVVRASIDYSFENPMKELGYTCVDFDFDDKFDSKGICIEYVHDGEKSIEWRTEYHSIDALTDDDWGPMQHYAIYDMCETMVKILEKRGIKFGKKDFVLANQEKICSKKTRKEILSVLNRKLADEIERKMELEKPVTVKMLKKIGYTDEQIDDRIKQFRREMQSDLIKSLKAERAKPTYALTSTEKKEIAFSRKQGLHHLSEAIWKLSLDTIDTLIVKFHFTDEEWNEATRQLQLRYSRLMPVTRIVTFADWLAHYEQYSECCLYDYDSFLEKISENQKEFNSLEYKRWVSVLVEENGQLLLCFDPSSVTTDDEIELSVEEPQCAIAKHPDFNWMSEQISAFEKLCQLIVDRLKQHGLAVSKDYQLLELPSLSYKK